MQKYQIIPRRYRPQKFSEVVSQAAIVTTLQNALKSGRIGSAYLFCGSRGTGKTTLARLLAKALNCETNNQEPCNNCSSCQEITQGRSLDVIEIDGASNRGIDDIRQITETVGYAPSSGRFKIYIIDEVHMLTKEAFNALLKTLEEPPAHAKFFFATTEPHKVLPTIISRCQRFDLGRIPPQKIEEKLMHIANDLGIAMDPQALKTLSEMADGSLRDAESLLDQISCAYPERITEENVREVFGLMSRDVFARLDQAILDTNLPFAFELANEIFSTGKDLTAFLSELLEHVRNHLHTILQGKKTPFTQDHALYMLDYLIQTAQQLTKTPFKRLTLETVLLHLIRSRNMTTIGALSSRLMELQKKLGQAPKQETPIQKTPLPVQEAPKPAPAQETPKPASTSELENKLLQAIQKKKEEPVQAAPAPQVDETPKAHPSKYDTLMRFAAVELEGTLKK